MSKLDLTHLRGESDSYKAEETRLHCSIRLEERVHALVCQFTGLRVVGDSATCGAARSRCRHKVPQRSGFGEGGGESARRPGGGRVAGVGRSAAPRRTEITDVNSLDLDGLAPAVPAILRRPTPQMTGI